ncbi:MAG: Na+/H+ antiporter NhaA, partial [Nitrospirae bacterium]|nr:Na+/H+ antiporter NhaA [Candidatus Troglogloeales bacterium]
MKRFKKVPSIVALLFEYSERLIEGVVIALVWANTDYASLHNFLHWSPFGEQSFLNFHFLINEILMVFFFGIATKEITQACLPGGALNPIKKAVNPLLGTFGGVIGPVCVYFLFVRITGNNALARGWAIPTATDIALAWLVARLVFGEGHPAISFLLLLAIADDGIGLAIIA